MDPTPLGVRLIAFCHDAYLMEHLKCHCLSTDTTTHATILIAPSSYDSNIICDKLDQDNALRQGIIKEGRPDPGRDENINWFEVRIRFRYLSACTLTIITKGTKGGGRTGHPPSRSLPRWQLSCSDKTPCHPRFCTLLPL